jgi:hypothetical protein
MSAEENMALACRFIEARVIGDLDAVDKIKCPMEPFSSSYPSAARPRRRRRSGLYKRG